MLLTVPGIAEGCTMDYSLWTVFFQICPDTFFMTDIQFAMWWKQKIIPVSVTVSQAAAQESAASSDKYFCFHDGSIVSTEAKISILATASAITTILPM